MSSIPPILEYASPMPADGSRRPIPGLVRFCGIWFGVLTPIGCFLLSIGGFPLGPDWQSGRWYDFVKLMLGAPSAWPLYPILAYSMFCSALVSFWPLRRAPQAWVRIGLYGGCVLAAQFSAVMLIAIAGETQQGLVVAAFVGLIILLVATALVALLQFLINKFGPLRVWVVIGVIVALVLAVALAMSSGGRSSLEILLIPLVVSPIPAPGLAFVTYLVLALYARRIAREAGESQDTLAAADSRASGISLADNMDLLIWAWIGAFLASWALAIHQAIRTYQRLPTSPPSRCYIASAAARGHRGFVRSSMLQTREGASFAVNAQLRRLKAAEIALATVAPRLHRVIRALYDCVGPILGSALAHPLLADVAYLLLKLPEHASRGVLRILVPRFDRLCDGLYRE